MYVALLRGINVGGRKAVAMADLRRLLEELRFENVKSLLQSGNLVFHGGSRAPLSIERLLEREASTRLGLDAAFFVRTADEWKSAIEANPFPEQSRRDPGHSVLMCLKDAPGKAALQALRRVITGPEIVELAGRHLFIVYPIGIGKSRLTNVLIEKTLGTRGTARNWNTVLKLQSML